MEPAGKPIKATAYRLFYNEHRDSVQAEFPELTDREIAKKLSEVWVELKKSDKEGYYTQADKLNEGFAEQIRGD